MKFTRLRVLGFKSFVEPTEFLIEPGLTGVVGPNGCGKSNLVEALRWVMGESSYKNMRASGMDDVIFSGSGNRPARNTAEVTLVVDNADRTAPAAFNDADQLEITRRIEREAGLGLQDQRPRRARPRRAAPLRRRLDRRPFAGDGRPGQDRRADRRQAAATAARSSKRPPAFPACTTAATRRSFACRAAEQNLARLDDVIARDRDAARDAEAAGAAGGALPQPLRRDPQGRGDRAPSPLARRAAAALAEAEAALAEAGRARRRQRAERRPRAGARAGGAPPPPSPTFATPRRAPARRCSGIDASPARRSTARRRASASASPISTAGSPSSATTSPAKSGWSPTTRAILVRLDEEETRPRRRQRGDGRAPGRGRGARGRAPRRRLPRARRRSPS